MNIAKTPSVADLTQLIQALLQGELGRQTMDKLKDGQGSQTDDGKTWLRARDLIEGLKIQQGADPEVEEFLGLKSRVTGVIARLRTKYIDDRSSYCLSSDPALPYFRAEDLRQIERLLLTNKPWYSTSPELPDVGNFDVKDLVPVRVRLTVDFEELQMQPVLIAQTVLVRDAIAKLVKNYAGREIVAEGGGHLVFWLVRRQESMSLDDMKAWEDQLVYSDKDVLTRRKVYAVCEVPEEWVPELKGSPGALLIASETRFE
jgi:hypothetical protein